MNIKRPLTLLVIALACLPLRARAEEIGPLECTVDLVLIHSGDFGMGSQASEKRRRADEDPVNVQIRNDFLMSKFPITRGQFAAFVKDTHYKTEAEDGKSGGFGWDGSKLTQRKDFTWRSPGFEQTDDHPVVLVTLKDAKAFCTWLSRKSSRKITLPTEAQFEFACRAGTTSRFYSGDDDTDADDIAWTKSNSLSATHPVGKKKPNDWGLYDMSGNVYQWCSDLYGPYRRGGPTEGPMDKDRYILRGGSWLKAPADARSAARYKNAPGARNADNGFRIVAELKPLPALEPAVAPTPAPVLEPPVAPDAGPRFTMPAPPVAVPAAPGPAGVESVPFAGLASCLCPLLGLGGIGAIIFFIFRAMRTGNSSQPSIPPINRPPQSFARPQIADDGFFLDTSGHRPGDVLTYTYDSPDGPITSEYIVEQSLPSQFIYTGVRPANLMLTALGAASLMNRNRPFYQQPPPIQQTYSPPTTSYRDDRPSTHFPSAY